MNPLLLIFIHFCLDEFSKSGFVRKATKLVNEIGKLRKAIILIFYMQGLLHQFFTNCKGWVTLRWI
jgi:hypothetical protein